MKRKAKFKQGQFAIVRGTQAKNCWKMVCELGPFDEGGAKAAWYTSKGYILEKDLRPLTKRETAVR